MTKTGTGLAGRILVATLLATTTLAGGLLPAGRAQAQEATSYDIPAGSLSTALAAFGRQSGLQLAYDPALAAGKKGDWSDWRFLSLLLKAASD